MSWWGGFLRLSAGFVAHRQFQSKTSARRFATIVYTENSSKFGGVRPCEKPLKTKKTFIVCWVFLIAHNFETQHNRNQKQSPLLLHGILISCLFYASLNQTTCTVSLNQTACMVNTHVFVSPSLRKRIVLS